MNLIMTKGLPGSGKSTWAKAQVTQSNGKVKRVNKDDLRAMIDNGTFSKPNEKQVLDVRDSIIRYYLDHNHDVIVDDTNFAPKHEEALREIATEKEADFEVISFLDVSLAECIKRDALRPNSVGEKVIQTMYNTWLKPKTSVAQYQAPEYDPYKPFCIMVDIDGTLAHMTDRSPYDYSKIGTDTVDLAIKEIVRRYFYDRDRDATGGETYTTVIIVSGRHGCYNDTEQWLEKNAIPYDYMFMRADDDKREDSIVKREIYETKIKPRYNVRFVLDDRDRVVKMWRELGLKCLQVAPGDF